MEQIGSAIIHPNICIRIALTITPTDPRVSANICRNTPYNKDIINPTDPRVSANICRNTPYNKDIIINKNIQYKKVVVCLNYNNNII